MPLSSAQMHAWFVRLADAVSRPLFLYNIPMTTRMSIPVETVMALADHPNIAGMKDSEYDVARMERLLEWRRGRPGFQYFVGPSVMALQGLRLGADGFVPGVGNVVPAACRRLLDCARAGDWDGAEAAQADMKRVGDTYMPARSVVLEQTVVLLYWVMIAAAAWLLLRGHNAPGGGFIAALVLVMRVGEPVESRARRPPRPAAQAVQPRGQQPRARGAPSTPAVHRRAS